MFKRSQRFSFRTGVPKKKIVTPLFILRFQEANPQDDGPKYAVVASKSVSKKAVHRNRVKRIFLQILKELLEKQPNNNTLVFFLRRPYTQYSKSAIILELQNLFQKLEVSS
jgi:ribonuclease P protein component